jgi:hypothetical protein
MVLFLLEMILASLPQKRNRDPAGICHTSMHAGRSRNSAVWRLPCAEKHPFTSRGTDHRNIRYRWKRPSAGALATITLGYN